MLKISKIPDQDLQTLEALAALSEQDARHLADAVANARPAIGRAVFVEEVTRSLPGMKRESADKLIRVLLAMVATRIAWQATAADFIDALAAADNVVESKVFSKASSSLKERLSTLLSIESAFLTAKAATILSAHEHPFEEAAIFTDIRPVFGDEGASSDATSPSAAVLVHQLRLRLGGENQPQELFVAMDNRDLDTLAKLVDRARRKSKALAQLMHRANLPHLEPPRE